VKETVVVVRTEQRRGTSPRFGRGNFRDGKVLTAAHVVQTADKIAVQFADNQTSSRARYRHRLFWLMCSAPTH